MHKSVLRFIFLNLLLTAICVVAIICFYVYFFEMSVPGFVYFSFAYFPVTGITNHVLLSLRLKKESRKFVNAFMLSTSVRIFLAMIVLTVCILTVSEPVPLVLVFSLQYFLFFILDIFFLMQLVKQAQQNR